MSAATVGFVVADRLDSHVMIVRGVRLLTAALDAVVVVMLVLVVGMSGRVRLGNRLVSLFRSRRGLGGSSSGNGLLIATASTRKAAIENAAADAAGRLEIGAVLFKGLAEMGAAS